MMEILNLQQGTPEWHAHRAKHYNASDAPAMMGVSPHKSRTQLIAEYATGIIKEVDAAAQSRFDEGHRTEALARPLAEKIIGDDLYPVTGVNGKYSASFDGLTMDERFGYEHKLLSSRLENISWVSENAADFLPLDYLVQMEHQSMVSGLEKTLFMASKWDDDGNLIEKRHCWYLPNQSMREQIIAGWAQFEKDVAAYVPAEVAPAVVAAPVIDLPAVSVQVSGSITIADNFKMFETALRDFVENRLIKKPATDQDFADLEAQIKSLKKAEDALDAAEASMLSQVASVDEMKRTKDLLHKLARDNRLAAEKLLAAEKEARRAQIVRSGVDAFAKHIQDLNERLGKPYMPQINADFAGAIKGLRTISSLQNAVADELARVKIEADTIAAKIETNLNTLRELAKDHPFLFADTPQLVMKATDDLVTLIKMRISEHQQAEAAKLEAERERIRQEEEIKARAAAAEEQAKREAAEQAAKLEQFKQNATYPAPQTVQQAAIEVTTTGIALVSTSANDEGVSQSVIPTKEVVDDGSTMKLGDIAKLLGFSLTEQFIEELGIKPTGRERNAVLYRCADFPAICERLIANINAASVDFHEQRKAA
jgi:putative phage-type endonuclease